MIGQTKNKELIEQWKEAGFPQFVIISGNLGSGKKTLSHFIATMLNLNYVEIEANVDGIREMISTASKVPAVYVISDGDLMSVNAKNAILKITEEPPVNSYFILTVQDYGNVLDTLKSRSQHITMETYTKPELMQYKSDLPADYYSVARNMYELDMLISYTQAFLDYVQLVVDNLYDVESANAFKSSQKLSLASDNGYDLALFLRTFMYYSLQKGTALDTQMSIVANKYLRRVKPGVNKQQLYDQFVLEVRRL